MAQTDQPSEEFLDAVLAIHDRDPAAPADSPDNHPADSPDVAGSEAGDGASTTAASDQDGLTESPESAKPKKRRAYATKKRMKAGTNTFKESIDWMLARIRRARGDTYAEIAADIGCSVQTLTARFSREGWAREIDALHEAAQRRFENATNAAVTKLVEQGKTYKEKMARASLVFADSVAQMTGQQLLAKAKDISSLNSVARQTLGLDEGDKESKTIVNIGFLSQLAEEQGVAISASRGPEPLPAIEVEALPEAESVPPPSPLAAPTE